MIVDKLENAGRYASRGDDLAKGFEFILRVSLDELPVGRYSIDGDRIVGLVQSYTTERFKEDNWETHDRHLDLHAVIAGEEAIHWTSPMRLAPVGDYDSVDDTRMHRSDCGAALQLASGWFVVFHAGEPHQPRCHARYPMEVRKIVVKILE